jgi:hypothetical protein
MRTRIVERLDWIESVSSIALHAVALVTLGVALGLVLSYIFPAAT